MRDWRNVISVRFRHLSRICQTLELFWTMLYLTNCYVEKPQAEDFRTWYVWYGGLWEYFMFFIRGKWTQQWDQSDWNLSTTMTPSQYSLTVWARFYKRWRHLGPSCIYLMLMWVKHWWWQGFFRRPVHIDWPITDYYYFTLLHPSATPTPCLRSLDGSSRTILLTNAFSMWLICNPCILPPVKHSSLTASRPQRCPDIDVVPQGL